MTLARYNLTAVDSSGNILAGASVEVRREEPGTPLASLFTDRTGLSAAGNPLTADANGDGGFYCAGGFYQITVTSGAFAKTWRYVPIGLAQGLDLVSLENDVVGNLPVTNLDGGTNATNTRFWRGDGIWSDLPDPPVTGSEIHFSSYNPVGDGSANDTVPMQNFIAAINASTDFNVVAKLGSGHYAIASATMGNLYITRDRVTLEGDGAKITVTGSTVTSFLFGSQGCNFITYRGISFVGNSQANAYANGVAIAFTSDNTNGNASNLLVENCQFANFKGDYWIWVESLGTTTTLGDIFIRNNVFTSQTGNTRGPSNVAISSAAIGILNVNTDLNYPTINVQVTGNTIYADYIKTGVLLFAGIQEFWVQNNLIYNAGQQGISEDSGAYAILLYQNNGNTNGQNGVVTGNRIVSPFSIGIYVANRWTGTIIANNEITSQGTDNEDATLPKGGIALNGCVGVSVIGNTITGTTRDAIFLNTGNTVNTSLNIANNMITTCRYGIRFQAATYNGSNITIQGNIVRDPAVAAISLEGFTTSTTTNITVRNNSISLLTTSSAGISVTSPDASYKLFYVNIQGNTIMAAAAVTLTAITYQNFPSTAAFIRDNTLFGTFSTGVTTTGSTSITASNNLTQA